MGNNPSRPTPPAGSGGGREGGEGGDDHGSGSGRGSGGTSSISQNIKERDRDRAPAHSVPSRKEPRRRDSIQAISSGKASAAPPSESLASAVAQNASQSRHQQTSSTSSTSHARPRSRTVDTPTSRPQSEHSTMGQEQSRNQEERLAKEKPYVYRGAQPMAVPGQNDGTGSESGRVDPSGPPQEPYYVPIAQAQRPPRLPLRIEEEVHTPGSPIISPADVSSALDHDEVEGALPRKSSLLSSTTLGDDDDEDGYQHTSEFEPSAAKTIPTLIEWRQGGKQVYVTGTFAAWDRKFRLHRTSDPHVLSTTVQLSPGTHHIKFIVDGDMKLADDLPTAVDYTNILVNYIEVSADDITQHEPSKPVNIIQPHPPPGIYPPQVLPPTPEPTAHARRSGSSSQAQKEKKPVGELIPPRDYGSVIPQYLTDGEQGEDGRPSHRRGDQTHTPSPPSLPLFLSKSILNGTSLMKDDASVLNVPNHTILNHLATSSIKNGVLATSGTTRYQRKYVSTILYKPTSEED